MRVRTPCRASMRAMWWGLGLILCVVRGEEGGAPGEEAAKEEGMWMDEPHQWVTDELHWRMVWLNSMFYTAESPTLEDPRARFRVKVFTRMDLEERLVVSPETEFFASVRLPGLRDRFRVVLETEGEEDLERNPDEVSDRPRLALRRVGRWVNADLGVQSGMPPKAYARSTFRQSWHTDELEWRFRQRFYYETGEGFGEVTSLSQHAWLGPRVMLGHRNAVRWSEGTRGVEWSDTTMVAFIPDLLEEHRVGRFVGGGDMAHGLGVRLRVAGFHDGSHEMDRYTSSLIYRRPLFGREYLFLEVVPEVEWSREGEWDPVYRLRAGIDVLFWRDL